MSESDDTRAATLASGYVLDPQELPSPATALDTSAPATRPLGPLVGSLIFLAYLVAQVIAGAVVGMAGAVWFIARRGHPYPEVVADVQRYLLMPTAVVGVLVGGLAAGGLSALALRGSGLAGRQSIGWVSASRRSLFFAGIAGAALAGLYLVAAAYIPEPPGRSFGPVTSAVAGGGSARHLWALLAMVLAPPIEEFVFRGVLFGGLSRSWSPAPAGALVTLIFVCAHLGEVSGHPTAIAWVGVLGIVLLWVRVRTGSLLPGVVLHGFYNLVLVIAVYAGTT